VEGINWHTFFFLLFALVTCVFSVAVVITGNVVRMAFYLILALGATAGLFFLAGASFVGAMQLMIYVGGTLVLLIFGVMLTAQGPFVSMRTHSIEWVLAVVVGGSLLGILVQAAFSVPEWQGGSAEMAATVLTGSSKRPDAQLIVQAADPSVDPAGVQIVFRPESRLHEPARVEYQKFAHTLKVEFKPDAATAADVARAFEGIRDFRVSLPAGSAGDGAVTANDGVSFPGGDLAPGAIGLALLGIRPDTSEEDLTKKSDYLLPFEIISVHLLVVLIAAAYLARTKKRVTAT
jgi:NADH:ubiquinone oxidoreductase subunit 6 (subunit J)